MGPSHKIFQDEVYDKEMPKNRPLTPVPESVDARRTDRENVVISDWRAGVKIKFEVTGSNSSTI